MSSDVGALFSSPRALAYVLLSLAACGTPDAETPRAPSDGCAPVLAENVAAPDQLLAFGEQLYFIDQTSTLFRTPSCAGKPQRATSPAVATLGGTTLAGGWLLESNEKGTALRQVGTDQSAAVLGGPSTHVLMAVNEEFVVWVRPNTAEPTPLWAAPRGGGAPWKVVEGAIGVSAITMDESNFYYATPTAVMRSGLDLSSHVELIARPGGVSALAVDDQAVYVAFRSGGFKEGGAITKLPKNGGLLLTLASEKDAIIDAEKVGDAIVYVTRSDKGVGSVHEIPSKGGIGKDLGPAKDPCGVTADAKAVYVASCAQGRGAIRRIPR